MLESTDSSTLNGRRRRPWQLKAPSGSDGELLRFRFRALSLHLLGSATVLTLVWSALYLGWYRWPGWYLAGALRVVATMAIVDLGVGPLLTFVVANRLKPRRELVRDLGIIVAVQIAALIYGVSTLWQGRPLYYAFSFDRLQLVQASDLDRSDVLAARKDNPQLAPRWDGLPRWVWAPLPTNRDAARKIVTESVFGGKDVVQMPRYFHPWALGLPSLRKRLRRVDDLQIFSKAQKSVLKGKMQRLGLASDQPDAIFLTGREDPVLAVFDRDSMKIRAIIAPTSGLALP